MVKRETVDAPLDLLFLSLGPFQLLCPVLLFHASAILLLLPTVLFSPSSSSALRPLRLILLKLFISFCLCNVLGRLSMAFRLVLSAAPSPSALLRLLLPLLVGLPRIWRAFARAERFRTLFTTSSFCFILPLLLSNRLLLLLQGSGRVGTRLS
jgi:hypothetical protein